MADLRANEIVDLIAFGPECVVGRPNAYGSSIDKNNLGRNDVVGGRAVNWDVRAGGIVCDHSAERGARTCRNIGPKTKSVRLEKGVQLIEHNPGANLHRAIFDFELGDLAIVSRKIDNQSFADRVADQTRARTARDNRNARIGRRANDTACLLRASWKGRANRFDLINRRIRRVKLSRQVIKPNVATRLLDFPLWGGSHSDFSNLACRCGLESALQRPI